MQQRLILLPSQKSEVFRTIIQYGLDPNDFNWIIKISHFNANNLISGLNYKKTSCHFYFEVRGNTRLDYAVFSPGKSKIVEEVNSGEWDSQMVCVNKWISYLIRELNEPDLWEGLKMFHLPIAASEKEDSPLTESEVENISLGINELKDYILKNFQLQAEEASFVSSQFDFLKKTLRQQSKKGIYFFIFNIIFAIYNKNPTLFNEHAMTVFKIVKGIFAEALKTLPPFIT
ncbi:MAG: hypothetical protein NTZ12_04595 [Candidatus Aminicenantes bacterium]|nr:hypothetical protein [Candidatus Aminicenantes bacterium]